MSIGEKGGMRTLKVCVCVALFFFFRGASSEEEDLSSVRVVDASHNEISELPSALRQMASVSRVNFSENKLHQVDLSVIKDLSKLKDLNLSGNSISKLSFSSDWKPLALDTLRLGVRTTMLCMCVRALADNS